VNAISRFHDDEQGIALMMALLGVVILAGLAVVFMGRATTETRASAASRDHEITIHVAEAAADRQIAEINADDLYVTTDRIGSPITFGSGVVDERAWAIDLIDDLGPDGSGNAAPAWIETDSGEAYAVRPEDAAGDPLNVLWAVGAVPGFDSPNARIRVIKLQIDRDRFIPEHALLTDGLFTFNGSAEILVPGCDPSTPQLRETTCVADVHTNSRFEQGASNSAMVQGRVSQVSGTCPSGFNAVNGCVDGGHGVAPQPVPRFEARDFYNRRDDFNPDPGGRTVDWYDLCPPGKPAAVATVRKPSGMTPCTAASEQIWPHPVTPDGSTTHRGWRWQNGAWRAGSVDAGVFYIYQADAVLTGSDGSGQRAVSILIEQDPARVTTTGSMAMTGNARLQSGLANVLFVVDGDLDMQGSGSGCGGSSLSGFIGVGEQIKIQGGVTLAGAIIVRDVAEGHPMVKRSEAGIQGTMCLDFDRNLDIDFTGRWVITYWNEL
jgi:hypothetical protein